MIPTLLRRRFPALAAALVALLAGAAGCATAQSDAELIAKGQQMFFDKGCHGCHNVGAAGTPQMGGDLTRIGAKYNRAELARWLEDPAAQKPTAHMPRIALPSGEVQALAAYLASLR